MPSELRSRSYAISTNDFYYYHNDFGLLHIPSKKSQSKYMIFRKPHRFESKTECVYSATRRSTILGNVFWLYFKFPRECFWPVSFFKLSSFSFGTRQRGFLILVWPEDTCKGSFQTSMTSFHKAQPFSDPISLCAWLASSYLRYGLFPDFGMRYVENHLAHWGEWGLSFFCIFCALSFELNVFFSGVAL